MTHIKSVLHNIQNFFFRLQIINTPINVNYDVLLDGRMFR